MNKEESKYTSPGVHNLGVEEKVSAVTVAFGNVYLNTRYLHEDERIVFSGPVKIEDPRLAKTGQILLKHRFAVLCPSRLLLYKNEKES